MAQDPVNTATLYAGSAFGGLWKTDNRGDTWRPISFFLPAHPNKEATPPIGAIGICHRTPDTIYVGTGEPVPYKPPGIGLYRSVDGGRTFQELVRRAAARSTPSASTGSWSIPGSNTGLSSPARPDCGGQVRQRRRSSPRT